MTKKTKVKSKNENHNTNKNNIHITIHNDKKTKKTRRIRKRGNPEQGLMATNTSFSPSIINTSTPPIYPPYEPNLNKMAYDYINTSKLTTPNNAIEEPSKVKILTPKFKPPNPEYIELVPEALPTTPSNKTIKIKKLSPTLTETPKLSKNRLFDEFPETPPINNSSKMDIPSTVYPDAGIKRGLDFSVPPKKRILIKNTPAIKIPKKTKSILNVMSRLKSYDDVKRLPIKDLEMCLKYYTSKTHKYSKATKINGVNELVKVMGLQVKAPQTEVLSDQQATTQPVTSEAKEQTATTEPDSFIQHPNIEYQRGKTKASSPALNYDISSTPMSEIKADSQFTPQTVFNTPFIDLNDS